MPGAITLPTVTWEWPEIEMVAPFVHWRECYIAIDVHGNQTTAAGTQTHGRQTERELAQVSCSTHRALESHYCKYSMYALCMSVSPSRTCTAAASERSAPVTSCHNNSIMQLLCRMHVINLVGSLAGWLAVCISSKRNCIWHPQQLVRMHTVWRGVAWCGVVCSVPSAA